jgi:hypothetical protein
MLSKSVEQRVAEERKSKSAAKRESDIKSMKLLKEYGKIISNILENYSPYLNKIFKYVRADRKCIKTINKYINNASGYDLFLITIKDIKTANENKNIFIDNLLNETLSKKEQLSVVLDKILSFTVGRYAIFDNLKETIKTNVYRLDLVFNTLTLCKEELIDIKSTDIFLQSLGKDFETSAQRLSRNEKSEKYRKELNIGSRIRSLRRKKVGGKNSKTRKHK